MRRARLILRDVDPECYGRLQVDDSGQPVTDWEITNVGTWKAPRFGGALPAFPGMDSEMIAGLIAEYGPEGSRYTGARENAGRERGCGGPGDPPETDGQDEPKESNSSFDI